MSFRCWAALYIIPVNVTANAFQLYISFAVCIQNEQEEKIESKDIQQILTIENEKKTQT